MLRRLRYFAIAPTFRAIDHSLSLRMTIRRLVQATTLFSASIVMPQVNAASPQMATTCSCEPRRSRAVAIPRAADRAVPA